MGRLCFPLHYYWCRHYLIHLWEIKVAGSLYLIYLVIAYFRKSGHPKQAKTPEAGSKISSPHRFWRTVASIELMDIVFFQLIPY